MLYKLHQLCVIAAVSLEFAVPEVSEAHAAWNGLLSALMIIIYILKFYYQQYGFINITGGL